MKKYIKKGDIVIIAALLSLAAALLCISLIPGRPAESAIISRGGEIIAVLPLDTDAEYIISDGDIRNVIVISGGGAYMREASCPDKSCVHQGAVSRSGDAIICLPNRVTVTISGEPPADAPDAIAY